MIQSRLHLKDATVKATVRRFLDYSRRKSILSKDQQSKALRDILTEIDYLEIDLLKQENQLLRLKNFEQTKEKNEEGLLQVKQNLEKEVESMKEQLEEARRTRQKIQEYENIAARTLKYPPVSESFSQKECLEKEIEDLEREAGSIDNDYSLNLNKLHTVLHLLEDLSQDS